MEVLPLETTIKVLLELDYPSLINYCSTNSVIYSICQDEYFWKEKLGFDYPKLLPYKPGDMTYLEYSRKIYNLPNLMEFLSNQQNVLEYYMLLYYGFNIHDSITPEKLNLINDVLRRSLLTYEYEDDWDPWDNAEDPRWNIDSTFTDLMYDAVKTDYPEIVDYVIEAVFDNFYAPHDYDDIFLLSKAFDEAVQKQNDDIINILLKYYIPYDWIEHILNNNNNNLDTIVNTIPELSTIILKTKGLEWEEANPELSSILREVMPYTFRYNSSGSLPFYKMMLNVATTYNPKLHIYMAEEYRRSIEKAKRYVDPKIAEQF